MLLLWLLVAYICQTGECHYLNLDVMNQNLKELMFRSVEAELFKYKVTVVNTLRVWSSTILTNHTVFVKTGLNALETRYFIIIYKIIYFLAKINHLTCGG